MTQSNKTFWPIFARIGRLFLMSIWSHCPPALISLREPLLATFGVLRPVSDKGCHFLAPPMTFFPISLRRIFRPRFQSAALMDGPDRPIFFFSFFSDLADANYYYRYYMITVITPSYLCFFWWAGRVKKWRRSPSGRADRWKSLDTDQRQCLA